MGNKVESHGKFITSAENKEREKEIFNELRNKYSFSNSKLIQFSIPFEINKLIGEKLSCLCKEYHNLIEEIVSSYHENPDIQEVLNIPEVLREDVKTYRERFHSKVEICRLDLYFNKDSHPFILETNANCPGLLLYSGIAAKAWRKKFRVNSQELKYEDNKWFSEWYLSNANSAIGRYPEEVALLRLKGGHSLEFDEISNSFSLAGVKTFECDPRELTLDADGYLSYESRRVQFAYSKLSVPDYVEMRSELSPFFEALGNNKIYLPNGICGRFIGDNKLCLAILSDERFHKYFNKKNIKFVSKYIPWSRNISLCRPQEIDGIIENKEKYVLKKPMDTQARGVVIGKELSERKDWNVAVAKAIQEGWLVMEYIEPIIVNFGDKGERYDLAIGLINGSVIGGFSRSSTGHKVNVAQNGKLHPLFWDIVT